MKKFLMLATLTSYVLLHTAQPIKTTNKNIEDLITTLKNTAISAEKAPSVNVKRLHQKVKQVSSLRLKNPNVKRTLTF